MASTPDLSPAAATSPANALTVTALENEVKDLKAQINAYDTVLAANIAKIEELKKVNEENQAGIDQLGDVLRALIQETGASGRDELRVTLDKLKQKFAELEAAAACGNSDDTTVKSLEEALKQRDTDVKSLTEKLQQRDTDVKSLEEALQQRDTDVMSLEEKLQQRDTDVKSLEETLQQRDTTVKSLEEALKQRDTDVKSLTEKLRAANSEIGTLKVLNDSTRPPSTSSGERSGSSGPPYDSQSPRAKAARRMLNGETLESRNHADINPKDVLACNKQKLINKIKNAENDLANLQIELEKLDAAPERREDLKRTRELEKEVNEADRKIKAARKQAAETKAKADAVIAENERKLREAKDRKAAAEAAR